MPYSVSLSSDGQYIVCRVTGDVTVEIAREFREDFNRLSATTNVKRFLTDARGAPNKSSVFENYSYAYADMQGIGVPKNSRSAILVDLADRSHDFVETVTRNAGYTVRIFNEERPAISWLLGSDS